MSEQVVWVFAWIFLLIMGGVTMIGVYLIFGRKTDHTENSEGSEPGGEETK